MRKFVNKVVCCGSNAYCKAGVILTVGLMSIKAFAEIPAAPNIPGGSTTDFIKDGQSVGSETLNIMITFLYVLSIMGYCSVMLYLFSEAKRNKEWGGFLKAGGMGLGLLVIVLLLLNNAKTALG